MTTWQTEAYRTLTQRLAPLVGLATTKEFAKLGVTTLDDLLRHVPRRYMRTHQDSALIDVREGEEASLVLTVEKATRAPTKKPDLWRFTAWLTDGVGGHIEATFFGRRRYVDYWEANLTPGTRGLFAGRVGRFKDRRKLVHPDYVTFNDRGEITGGAKSKREKMQWLLFSSGLLGVYPATQALPTWTIAQTIAGIALPIVEHIWDPLPREVVEDRKSVV